MTRAETGLALPIILNSVAVVGVTGLANWIKAVDITFLSKYFLFHLPT